MCSATLDPLGPLRVNLLCLHTRILNGGCRFFISVADRDPIAPSSDRDASPIILIGRSIPRHRPSLFMLLLKECRSPKRAKKNLYQLKNSSDSLGIFTRDRIREENRFEIVEARELWRRSTLFAPNVHSGRADGFAESAIRIVKWGDRFLELFDLVGKGGAKSTSMTEMYQKRRRFRKSTYAPLPGLFISA